MPRISLLIRNAGRTAEKISPKIPPQEKTTPIARPHLLPTRSAMMLHRNPPKNWPTDEIMLNALNQAAGIVGSPSYMYPNFLRNSGTEMAAPLTCASKPLERYDQFGKSTEKNRHGTGLPPNGAHSKEKCPPDKRWIVSNHIPRRQLVLLLDTAKSIQSNLVVRLCKAILGLPCHRYRDRCFNSSRN